MWCSAINCTNSRKKKPQLSFFRFPKDEERCRQWVQLCRRQDLVDKSTAYVSENCRLCANHFEETQFMNYQKRDSLVWNAVPTLFHFSSPPKRLKFRCRPPLPRKQDLMMSKTGKRPRVVAQKQKKQIAEDLYACTSTAPTSEQLHSSDSDHSTSTEAKRAKISVTESTSNVATRMSSKETVNTTKTTFSREPVAISTDSMLRITSPKVPMVDADEMVNICAGLNCRNTRQKCPGMKFLRFPKDQARSNVWVQHTRRLDLRGKSAEYLHRTAVLCETHFDDDQWMDKDEKSLGLIPKAVPTLFDVPFPPLRMTVKRKLPRRRFADDQTEIGDMEHDHCYASSVDQADATDQTDASCCVLNCPNETKTGLRLYPFPADKTKFRKWVAYCGREPGWTPDIHSRLCELHFEDNQFIGGGGGGGDEGNEGRPLKAEAIPNRHYLSIPLTTGRKLRLLLDQAASQDKLVNSIRNYSGDSEITSCPELLDHSGTVENATQERLKMSKNGASESIMELSSIEKTELAIDLCKNLIAEMLLSRAELFLERVELISHLRDAWADGRSVSLLLADANQATDMEAKTGDAETETISINKSRNNRSEGSGIGQADICDQESTERTKQAQADEQDLYLNIECDVITEDSDCDTRMKQSDDICDEVVEKYEQASIDFGKYVARVLQRHDCNCPMKPKDLTELVGIVRKKFMTMELQLKRQTTEAVAALQTLNDRYKESSSTNSTSKMLGNFFNSFDGYWPPVPAKNVKRSDKNLVTKESPSTVPGVIKVSVGDASHRSNEGKGQETIEKPKSIHGKKAGLVNVPQIFTASGDAVLYQCIDCKQIFLDKVSCQVHAETGCKPVRGRQSVSKTKGGLIYECPHCHKTFPFFSKMIEHLPVHTKPFLCHSCGQRFAQEDMLTEHKSTCTAVLQASAKTDSTKKSSKSTGPVLCSTCGKQFLRKSSLYYHMRRHIGKPHHMCSFCGKLFYVNAVLVQHLRTHTGEKPYLCPQCPLRFVTTGLLQRHLRVHTGEKPYTCDICQRTFAQSNSLKTHRLTHSTEKPHSCMHCERAFRKRSSLIMHMRAHTKDRRPLTCKTCGKVFSSRARLATHEVIHTGRRPAKNYECSKCQKKFDTDRGLERHVTVVHSGQTPNKAVACNICHQRFFTTARLERHKELHHGKESSKNEAAMKGDSTVSVKKSVKGDTTTRVGDLVLQTLPVPN